nr:thermonuclease family protein [Chryseobacterium echinoideorum]
MKAKILFVLLFCSAILFAQTKGKIIKISDGDTITVLLEGNIQKKLRLAEVDCPESGQPFGKNAKDFTSQSVFVKKLHLWKPIQTDMVVQSQKFIMITTDIFRKNL